ncbi:MAG TPA: TonB-dependent receptor [Chthoniobacterales bacterium]
MLRPVLFCLLCFGCRLAAQETTPAKVSELDPITVTATRQETPLDRSPSSVTVITDQEIEERQYRFATDALRTVPGLTVVQTGTPGQLTSVFTRGARSDQTEVLLDGIPVNQSLSGEFNFADLTTDNLAQVEVTRGSQSALYGGRASGGVINLITRRGMGQPTGSVYFEGGSYDSFREGAASSGKLGPVDYAFGLSRFDTENSRANNDYRNLSFLGDAGVQIGPKVRLGLVALYTYADAGSPNTVFDPRPYDNLRTERYQFAPNLEFSPTEWWHDRLYVSYDQERQINNPNRDGFTGPTRSVLRRVQLEYQNNLNPVSWAALTSGFFYEHTNVYQERPEVVFGDPLIRDKTEEVAGFTQLKITPFGGLDLYANARYDSFRDYGSRFTYRFAGNYLFAATGTILRSSFGTGFTPPSSQDKIFGGNPNLKPDKEKAFDVGFEQPLWEKRLRVGLNYFYETTSNQIGFNDQFEAFNLGSARSQGVEVFLTFQPIRALTITANYTYLDAVTTSGRDISQPAGARLVRRPRNRVYGSIAYAWYARLTTTVEVESMNARQELNFGGPNLLVEDYTTVRFEGEWRATDWLKFTARIENLFDEKYSEVYGYPALGRTFYGGVSLRF